MRGMGMSRSARTCVAADVAVRVAAGVAVRTTARVVARGESLLLGAALLLVVAIAPLRAQDGGAKRKTASLPITVVPAGEPGTELALLITGDGGYVAADRRLAEELSKAGVAVVALNARAYLTRQRTPDQAAADAAELLQQWSGEWKRDRIMLIGYSRGADIMPFIANRLPEDLRAHVELMAILSPASRASFKFHWRDLLFDTARPTDLPVLPEVERLRGMQMLCVYGSKEKQPLCPTLESGLAQVVERDGGHRIGAGEAPALAQLILKRRKP